MHTEHQFVEFLLRHLFYQKTLTVSMRLKAFTISVL